MRLYEDSKHQELIVNGFWTFNQILAFAITITTASAIAWRIIRRLYRKSTTTHAKFDTLEALLEQIEKTGMSAGAEKSLARIDRRLLLTQAQIRLLMEISGTGYVETNKDGGLIYCNPQFIQWTGMTLDDAKGYGWVAAIHPEDRNYVMREWMNAVKDQRSIDLRYRYKHNSVIIDVRARCIVVRDDKNSEILGFVALIVPVESRDG